MNKLFASAALAAACIAGLGCYHDDDWNLASQIKPVDEKIVEVEKEGTTHLFAVSSWINEGPHGISEVWVNHRVIGSKGKSETTGSDRPMLKLSNPLPAKGIFVPTDPYNQGVDLGKKSDLVQKYGEPLKVEVKYVSAMEKWSDANAR